MRSLIALTTIPGIGSIRARHLIEVFGSAQAVLDAPAEALLRAGVVGQRVLEGRQNHRLFELADRELSFIQAHHIRTMIYGQEGYPQRLLDCPDAPTHLFQLGDTPLDKQHFVAIVGTRQCSQYGRDLVHRFVADLRDAVPDVTIVSGLALGIDVESHRASLATNTPTIGVVAHGLDRIYPYQHRDIARQMIQNGGSIVTEYLSGTQPERCNYLIFNNFSFLSTSFFCKIPSLFIIKIIGQFGHIKKSIVNFCKNFQFFSLFSKNVPIWCPFTLPISL